MENIPITNQKLILEALEFYGVAEIPGRKSNTEIMRFFDKIGYYNMDEETPWCSAFLINIVQRLDIKVKANLRARSWLHEGFRILKPLPGDIVIFWRNRKKGKQGHVGIVIKIRGSIVYTLGGNQNDSVTISPQPRDHVLEYRRLTIPLKLSGFDEDLPPQPKKNKRRKQNKARLFLSCLITGIKLGIKIWKKSTSH